MSHETDNQIRLRRAAESLIAARAAEAAARRALNEAIEATKRAKEKHEELFIAEEKAEVTRRKGAYDHCTK